PKCLKISASETSARWAMTLVDVSMYPFSANNNSASRIIFSFLLSAFCLVIAVIQMNCKYITQNMVARPKSEKEQNITQNPHQNCCNKPITIKRQSRNCVLLY